MQVWLRDIRSQYCIIICKYSNILLKIWFQILKQIKWWYSSFSMLKYSFFLQFSRTILRSLFITISMKLVHKFIIYHFWIRLVSVLKKTYEQNIFHFLVKSLTEKTVRKVSYLCSRRLINKISFIFWWKVWEKKHSRKSRLKIVLLKYQIHKLIHCLYSFNYFKISFKLYIYTIWVRNLRRWICTLDKY